MRTQDSVGHAKVGVLALEGYARAHAGPVSLLPRDAAGYARGLYAALHALDDAGVRAIVIEGLPGDEAWAGAADRVRRAASGASDAPGGEGEER